VKVIEQIARAFWEAEASRDVDRIVSFFTPDADWGSAASRRRGHTAIREYYAGAANQFPGLTVEVGRVYGDDSEAAIEWHALFTDRGGRTYPQSGVSLFRRQGKLIASLTHYEDPTPLTRAPAPVMQIARKDRFAGCSVLVTGAGGGIGAATARQFLAEGGRVTAIDVSREGLERQQKILGELAERCQPLVGDVTDRKSYDHILEAAVDASGALHVLVNNAAVFLLAGVAATDHQWQRTMDVNVMGPALLTAHAADALARSGRGSIVNIASISAHKGQPNRWTYNASKGAIVAMTRCQALDLAPRGIRANSISPGYVWTDVIDRAAGGNRAKWDPIFGAACPMRRCSDPHEIATAVAFLASEEASYITGADLLVDGGLVSMTPDGLTPYEFS
jgi:NAD(P)-dependent dehydrogenase (short-subunit alcohol dehydrogenase family)/ketosteroid isomerase-like protein